MEGIAAGGGSNEGAIGAVEIYNPDLDTWQLIEDMNMFRHHHTATLLANGEVLMVGGYAWSPTTDRSQMDDKRHTAEVFDPVTNTFYLVGEMNHSRLGISATLLPNGKVLIIGGIDNNSQTLNNAEIFDPATGSFSFTGSLVHGRRHLDNIVLLQDGTVFIRGGYGEESSRSAELFDSVNGQFEPIIALDGSPRRYEHESVLLASGEVLVTGGTCGGCTAGSGILSSVELYSPEIKSPRSVPSLIQPRVGHSVVVLTDGRVLVVGGSSEWREALSSVEIYYP